MSSRGGRPRRPPALQPAPAGAGPVCPLEVARPPAAAPGQGAIGPLPPGEGGSASLPASPRRREGVNAATGGRTQRSPSRKVSVSGRSPCNGGGGGGEGGFERPGSAGRVCGGRLGGRGAAAASHAAHVASCARSGAPRAGGPRLTPAHRSVRRRGWAPQLWSPGRVEVSFATSAAFFVPATARAGSSGPCEQRQRAVKRLGTPPSPPVGAERNRRDGKLCKAGSETHGRGAGSREVFKHPPSHCGVCVGFFFLKG